MSFEEYAAELQMRVRRSIGDASLVIWTLGIRKPRLFFDGRMRSVTVRLHDGRQVEVLAQINGGPTRPLCEPDSLDKPDFDLVIAALRRFFRGHKQHGGSLLGTATTVWSNVSGFSAWH